MAVTLFCVPMRASNWLKELNACERLSLHRKGKRTNLRLVDEVFRTFREEKAISDERTAKVEPRRSVAQAFEVSAADAEVRQRIVQAVVPLISAGAGFRADHARGETSILGQVGRLHDLE